MRKIKLTCRKKNGGYERKLYVDGEPLDCAFDPETELAEQFFDAFSPETLIEKNAARYADLVIVLRTDDGQMQEFGDFLAEHGEAVSHNCHRNSQNMP